MDFNAYKAEAIKWLAVPDDEALNVALLGVAGEAGSVVTEAKKWLIWETDTGRANNSGYILTPAVGQGVCKSGRTTNETCGNVSSLDHTDPYSSRNFIHQDHVSMSVGGVAGGDSGGPWFVPYTAGGTRYDDAVGITAATITTGCCFYGVYTRYSSMYASIGWGPNF